MPCRKIIDRESSGSRSTFLRALQWLGRPRPGLRADIGFDNLSIRQFIIPAPWPRAGALSHGDIMSFSRDPNVVLADGPAARPNQPIKSDLRIILKEAEAAISAYSSGAGSIAKATQANLTADLAHAADTMAWVYADATAANNGIYRKSGASGAGSWAKILNLPFSYIFGTDAGAGTANAIQVTTALPVSGSALIAFTPYRSNTTDAVTVNINGVTYQIRTVNNLDPMSGGIVAGSVLLGYASGSIFRLVSDVATPASIASARDQTITAKNEALEYRDDAQDARTASEGIKVLVAAALEQALAAASQAASVASGLGEARYFVTRADADAALATLPDQQWVEVQSDEIYNSLRTRYRKEGGALSLKKTFYDGYLRPNSSGDISRYYSVYSVPNEGGLWRDNALAIQNKSTAADGTPGNAALNFLDQAGTERAAVGYSYNIGLATKPGFLENCVYVECGNPFTTDDQVTRFIVRATMRAGGPNWGGVYQAWSPIFINPANGEMVFDANGGNISIRDQTFFGDAGQPIQTVHFMTTTSARFRESGAVNNFALGTNIADLSSGGTLTQDNPAIPSWRMNIGGGYDRWQLQRAVAGATSMSQLVTLLDIDGYGTLVPGTDNAQGFGAGSKRWNVIFAATGTINTSDASQKTVRGGFTDDELDAWGDIQSCIYQWKASIDEKGAEVARLHAGWIAQEVQAAFAARGLDASRYGLWCEDPVTKTVTTRKVMKVQKTSTAVTTVNSVEIDDAGRAVQVTKEVSETVGEVDYVGVVDEQGEPVYETMRQQKVDANGDTITDENGAAIIELVQVQKMHPVPVMEEVEVETVEEVSDGTRLGLRYDQCLVMETAWLRRELARLAAYTNRRAGPCGG